MLLISHGGKLKTLWIFNLYTEQIKQRQNGEAI
jgi:hypothetical protein